MIGLFSRFRSAIAMLATGAAALAMVWLAGRRSAEREAEARAMRDALDRADAGRDAVIDGRASGESPEDRLRRNDGSWDR